VRFQIYSIICVVKNKKKIKIMVFFVIAETCCLMYIKIPAKLIWSPMPPFFSQWGIVPWSLDLQVSRLRVVRTLLDTARGGEGEQMNISLWPRPCYRQPCSTITGLHYVSLQKNLRTTSVCSFYLRLSLHLGGCVRLVNDSPAADLYTCYVTDYNVSLYATYWAVYFKRYRFFHVFESWPVYRPFWQRISKIFFRPFKKIFGISGRQVPSESLLAFTHRSTQHSTLHILSWIQRR